jgi:PAS domain S-box-containing protein
MDQNKKLVAELNDKIALLEEIQNINKIGHWELYLDNNKVKWSEMVYDIHELPRNLDLNRTLGINFYHPNYREIISKAVENCIVNSEPFNLECKLITHKNNEKWVRATGRKLGDKLIGSFQDITDIKNQELKFKGIFNSTFTFLGFLDTNGVLLDVNDTAINLANIKHSDVIGKYFWDCYWWQISKQTQEDLKFNFKKALLGETVEYEVAVWIASQTPVTILFTLKPIFDDGGNVIYIIPEGRPVQELVDARRRYKSVLEGANMGSWEWNVQTGETIHNERWAEITGYTLEELAPSSIEIWKKLVHPNDWEESRKKLTACFEKKSEFYEIEARIKHKHGHWLWVLDRGKVMEWSKDGQPLWMYGTLEDITEYKRREEALRISEEAFRGNFENAAAGMAIISPEGKWLKVNRKICEIIGYTDEELMKLTFQDITHPEDLDIDLVLLKELIEGKRDHYQMEKRYFHKNGNIVFIILAVSAVKDMDGEILYFISQIIDISKRKIQELEIVYQQNLLSSFYKLSPIGIALNDYHTGKFVDVNDKLLEPTGYTKQEFLALSYWDVTPTEYEKLEVVALQQMESTSQYEKFDKEYVRKDGSRYPVSLQGVVVSDTNGKKLIWSFVRDVSKEKEAEKKLKEAVARLQSVLDASMQVSIIATDPQGKIILFNSGAEKMLGYRAEELVNQQTPVLIHLPEEIEKERKELSRKYGEEVNGFETFIYEAKKGVANTKEWTYLTKYGLQVPVLLSINKICVNDTITGYLGVATDISELKKVENEIRSLLSITEKQNDRLRNFAHIVSHNLRSHTFGISGVLDLFKLEYPDLASNEFYPLIEGAVQNLKQTVEDLTEIVKVNLISEEYQSINICEIIDKNIQSLTSQIAEAGIEIVNELPKDICVKGIVAYMDSIILNMMTNAIKYKSDDRKPILKIYYKKDSSSISLYFKDNGLGIDLKRHGDKLFGMYKTFHRHDDSRGVGLFITKSQIESMGGKIAVKSEVNTGTTFKITFKA